VVTITMPLDSLFIDQVCATLAMDSLNLDIKCHSNKDRDKFKFVDDLFYFEECLYTLEGSICLGVLQDHHDFLIVRHFRFNKTLKFISRD